MDSVESAMQVPSGVVGYLGLLCGGAGGLGGFVAQGPQLAGLGAILGYFLGKTIRSVVRTVPAGRDP